MNNIVFLLTKDCMSLESLPCYGGCKYYQGKTPNIDELAAKGTMFMRHYTAAPSTSMSMSAMLSGHYLHDFTKRKKYENVTTSEMPSIFDDFQHNGYKCHLVWDGSWMHLAWRFVREFGNESKTQIHNLDIAQPAGGNKKSISEKNVRDDKLLDHTCQQIYDTLNDIDYSHKQFVWVHLPHVLKGRRSWMDDMDVFDSIVGFIRDLVGDENIYLSSDHGHMNMHKHKIAYGFDVYEPAIRIPLITPRINGVERVYSLTSNIDIPEILKGDIPKHEYVISDTRYYAQPGRKTAIVGNRYKLIYNARNNYNELYDLEWDPYENYNILEERFYDIDRKVTIFTDELYFYPRREEALTEFKYLNSVREEIWRKPSFSDKCMLLVDIIKYYWAKMVFIYDFFKYLRLSKDSSKQSKTIE